MKRYIKAFTYISSAVSIDRLISQFPSVSEDDFDEILRLDPTFKEGSTSGGKYAVWLLNQFSKGNFDSRDYSNIKDALDMFVKRSRAFTYSDLGRYKNVDEFLEDSARVGELPLSDTERQKELQRNVRNAGDKDKKMLARDGEWELWQPLTYAGSISLAQWGGEKAKWCTAYSGDDSYWRHYSNEGPLYIFINTRNPKWKYQSSPSTESWFFDFDDVELGLDVLLDFLDDHPPFAKALNLHVDSTPMPFVFYSTLFQYDEVIKLDNIEVNRGKKHVIESYQVSTDVVLPRGTTLKSAAFSANNVIEHIVLPEGLEIIPSYAFEECYRLISVEIPKSVRLIKNGAFEGSSLKDVVLPNNVVLSRSVFLNTDLIDIKIPDGICEIPTCCFDGCRHLQNVRLSEDVTVIDYASFRGCESLKRINLPYGLKFLGGYCFQGCKSLTEIVIPDSLQQIYDSTFKGCDNLTVFIHTDEFDEGIYNCGVKEIVHDF